MKNRMLRYGVLGAMIMGVQLPSCGCHSDVSVQEQSSELVQSSDVTSNESDEPVQKQSSEIVQSGDATSNMFLDFFDQDELDADCGLIEVNRTAETGNYRITLCDALIDRAAVYLLVKLETLDNTALPKGDLSAVPSTYRSPVTDITFDCELILDEDDYSKYMDECTVYRLDHGEEENAGYFMINISFYCETVDFELDSPTLQIYQVVLYTPFEGAMTRNETVLTNEEVDFDIPVTKTVPYKEKTFPDGTKGYLSALGAYFATGQYEEYMDLHWTITFDDGSTLNSKAFIEGAGINSCGVIDIPWYKRYLDVEKISTIKIGGVEYEWK